MALARNEVGKWVTFKAFDENSYQGQVIRVNRGIATIRYYIKGTACVSYLPKRDWDRLSEPR